MIVPSIDLQGGSTVQLVGGEKKAIDAGDPRPIAEKFARVGDIAVIDLDAAMGKKSDAPRSNKDMILDLVAKYPCRVGGGIRDLDKARDWLDAGAKQIILGTAATPDLLKQLPKTRTIAALDSVDGEVVVDGWKTKTGTQVLDRIKELAPYVGGFLLTFVEREGRMGGTDLDRAKAFVAAAGEAKVTIAGGVTTVDEIAALHEMGADAQVGMAIYRGDINIADALWVCLSSDRPDGLVPTVVTSELGQVLGLCYSNQESLNAAIETGIGTFWSRKRGLWKKGATSGNTQEIRYIDVDCDGDALCFVVKQKGAGFCHLSRQSCFGRVNGFDDLMAHLDRSLENASSMSYTKKLLADASLLRRKLIEEAEELADANTNKDCVWEAADLIYFAMVAMKRGGASFADVTQELRRRAGKVRRRSDTEGV